jgi:hypothetical protein
LLPAGSVRVRSQPLKADDDVVTGDLVFTFEHAVTRLKATFDRRVKDSWRPC